MNYARKNKEYWNYAAAHEFFLKIICLNIN